MKINSNNLNQSAPDWRNKLKKKSGKLNHYNRPGEKRLKNSHPLSKKTKRLGQDPYPAGTLKEMHFTMSKACHRYINRSRTRWWGTTRHLTRAKNYFWKIKLNRHFGIDQAITMWISMWIDLPLSIRTRPTTPILLWVQPSLFKRSETMLNMTRVRSKSMSPGS